MQLLHQYGVSTANFKFSVYLAFSMWRKLIIMLPSEATTLWSEESTIVSLRSESGRFTAPSHLGAVGAVNRLDLCLPEVFLNHNRTINVASIRSAGGTEKFGAFLT